MATQKNLTLLLFIFALFFTVFFSACRKPSAEHWSDFVPQSTFFVIIPDANSTVEHVLTTPLIPLMDDITPSVMQLVTTIQSHASEPIVVDALLLHPSSSNNWEPVWITQSVDGLPERLTGAYQREYEQNQYEFKGYTIEKLFFGDRTVFMANLGNWTMYSESSISIESSIRSLIGTEENMRLSDEQLTPGSIIMNTESMGRWAQQLTQVMYRPFLDGIFEGASPIVLNQNEPAAGNWKWQLHGSMQLQDNTSALVKYVSQPAARFTLDRFIPTNAAGFSIFRVNQQVLPSSENVELTQETDDYIQANQNIWHTIQQSLRDEVAFVTFANSGPASSSEYLFLRTISDSSAIQSALNILAEEELLVKDESTYSVNSYLLGKLLGSDVFPIEDFYVTVYNNVLAIAQRKGLAESIGGDAARRRVMHYDDGYSSIRDALPQPLSSIHYINAGDFGTYIQPWLAPQNYSGNLLSNLSEFVITTLQEPGSDIVNVRLTSFQQEAQQEPFAEQWVFPLGGSEISGTPVLADLTGSARNEVIFSTENGYIYALATDGTVILQASTGEDVPTGPPVVYDWYGNNQNIIMQAAGNKVYAWNQSGTILPNFPILLDENITTPLTITDITGNGVAEIIVATADRNMHILNARGRPLNGWPQATNSVVDSKPLIAEIDNQQSLFAFSENTLHAWEVNGDLRENYPVFLTAQMQGSPYNYQDSILGSGLDGHLYSVGMVPLFADSLSSIVAEDFLAIQSLQVSNSSLNTTPSHHEVLMTIEDESFERRSLILLQTANGSVFLYDDAGRLRFTESMGQPSSANYPPSVLDINGDQRDDIIALADFGRLYAWDILSGERHSELPTAGMTFPVISDFLGNGKQEIIAQTREGLQCWTIHYTVRESTEPAE